MSDEVPDEQITIYSGMAPDGHAVECTSSTNSIKWLQYKDRQFIRNFPGCIINGGRLCCGKNTAANMLLMLTRITEEGLIPRLTFTNMLLHPEHFEDEYSNMILESANIKLLDGWSPGRQQQNRLCIIWCALNTVRWY